MKEPKKPKHLCGICAVAVVCGGLIAADGFINTSNTSFRLISCCKSTAHFEWRFAESNHESRRFTVDGYTVTSPLVLRTVMLSLEPGIMTGLEAVPKLTLEKTGEIWRKQKATSESNHHCRRKLPPTIRKIIALWSRRLISLHSPHYRLYCTGY
uniref:Uncharacterized protein n=1 Tax=Salmonella sp. TaxID=599 RepID=A0A482EVN9_SALSP|nr:hypothetical protein NNIBIDOC_00183 [Salmonella sp.]